MAKYEIKRSFPSFRRGEVVENPQWRNLPQLLRNGYVREIAEEVVKPEAEVKTTATKKKAK